MSHEASNIGEECGTVADRISDAHVAASAATTWINNADTKAGLLAAALAVVIGVLSQQDPVGDVLNPSGGWEWIGATIVYALVGGILVALYFLAAVVRPRSEGVGRPNRFGWPFLADATYRRDVVPRTTIEDEAWAQAEALASIAEEKFGALRVATISTFASLGGLLTWMVVAAQVS